MAAVSETIVREYFEQHEFLVRQHRKYIGQTRREEDDDIDFFVLNPHPLQPETQLPFVLGSEELRFVSRAVVVVLDRKPATPVGAPVPSKMSVLSGAVGGAKLA